MGAVDPPGMDMNAVGMHATEDSRPKRVQRGGSFLCTEQHCSSRHMVGTRGKGEASTGTNHLGFRCVQEAQAARLSGES